MELTGCLDDAQLRPGMAWAVPLAPYLAVQEPGVLGTSRMVVRYRALARVAHPRRELELAMRPLEPQLGDSRLSRMVPAEAVAYHAREIRQVPEWHQDLVPRSVGRPIVDSEPVLG